MAYNVGRGLTGALSGLSTGSSLGSFGGPIGTGIGAGIGGLLGLFSGMGNGGQGAQQMGGGQQGGQLPQGVHRVESFDQPQKEAIMNLLQQGLGQLQNPQSGFQPIAQEARRGFQEETIPGIAERFTGMGAGGQRSSAFAGELGKAASGLESQLGAQQAGFGLQQQQLAQNLAQLGLTPTFQYLNVPEKPGALGQLGGLAAQAGGSALGSYFGGGGSISDILQRLGMGGSAQGGASAGAGGGAGMTGGR